jgi:hypothetical protein
MSLTQRNGRKLNGQRKENKMSFDNLLVTASSRFQDPSEETLRCTAFGILWSNWGNRPSRVISPFPWTVTDEVQGHFLRDQLGEVRQSVKWGVYNRVVEFPSWEAYDTDQTKRELERAYKEIERLRDVQNAQGEGLDKLRLAIERIYAANEKGGPGSRKSVREIAHEAGILPTPEE